ncbi:MAG: HEAT repeat domain-containing protein [Chloroflexota bacterium]|nr:HEAT repeat domain-containing protein [Chloroflexota bacterium]
MQDNENEWSSRPLDDNRDGLEEEPQVPSTLLPSVLQRLGLTPGQAAEDFELSVDDLIAKLQSASWEERVGAVRALGKLENAVPIGMFSSVRHDEDVTVRAVTVHVLGIMGERTPLSWLVEALQDADWHVREVAVLALGKQGQRVPSEVLMTALHDKDSSVREAASFALQWNALNEKKAYGYLWEEERPMQRESYDTALSNGKQKENSFAAAPSDDWNGAFFEYSGNARPTPVIKEQAQAYAAREYMPHDPIEQEEPSYAYAGVMHAQGEKITSYRVRRKSQKGWWAVVIITAGLFLMLGRFTVSGVPSIGMGSSKVISISNTSTRMFPFDSAIYAPIFQRDLATGLHLTPIQLQEQLKQRDSIRAVAANQGISSSELEKVEISAFQDVFNDAVKIGDIDQGTADKLTQQIQQDPNFREKAALTLLQAASSQNP